MCLALMVEPIVAALMVEPIVAALMVGLIEVPVVC